LVTASLRASKSGVREGFIHQIERSQHEGFSPGQLEKISLKFVGVTLISTGYEDLREKSSPGVIHPTFRKKYYNETK